MNQFRTLFGKFFIMYWRSPSYNATRFVMTVRLVGFALRASCSLHLKSPALRMFSWDPTSA